jgi:hypothetical protein
MYGDSQGRRSEESDGLRASDAPSSAPFSSTTTRNSFPLSCSSCLRRIAALRPAGPAPTIQTSTSSEIRSTAAGLNSSRRLGAAKWKDRRGAAKAICRLAQVNIVSARNGRAPVNSTTRLRSGPLVPRGLILGGYFRFDQSRISLSHKRHTLLEVEHKGDGTPWKFLNLTQTGLRQPAEFTTDVPPAFPASP